MRRSQDSGALRLTIRFIFALRLLITCKGRPPRPCIPTSPAYLKTRTNLNETLSRPFTANVPVASRTWSFAIRWRSWANRLLPMQRRLVGQSSTYLNEVPRWMPKDHPGRLHITQLMTMHWYINLKCWRLQVTQKLRLLAFLMPSISSKEGSQMQIEDADFEEL